MSLDLARNLVLAAGAGTGKTHALVGLAMAVYAGEGGREPVDPRRVWAVTFTDKAAEELRSRITSRVRERLHGEGGGRWAEVLDALPEAPIGTFHSLALRLLREYPFEAGIDAGARILDESNDREMRGAVLERWVAQALDDVDSPAMMVARRLGGAWELRAAVDTLQRRLGEEGLDPADLLARSGEGRYDEARARARSAEALETLRRTLAPVRACEASRLTATRQMLEVEAPRIESGDVDDAARWYPALERVVRSPRGRGSLPREAAAAWKPFAAAWKELRGAWAAWNEARVGRVLVELVADFDDAWRAHKRRLGALSFVDLVRGARDLLRDDLQVRTAVKAKVGALLVDEFQDTNAVQLELVRLLAERRDLSREVGEGSEVATLPLEVGVLGAVGDRKQSIYEFRGADVALFAGLIEEAKGDEVFAFEALRRSYRAHTGLVEPLNDVFAACFRPGRGEGPFWVHWRADEDALEAQREALDVPAIVRLRVSGSEPRAPDRGIEAAALARHLESRILAPGRCRPADIAILVRSHAQIDAHVRALRGLGVRTRVLGGRGLLARRAVRDAIGLLATIADPGDPSACAALLRGPLGVCDDTFVSLVLAGRATARALAEVAPDSLGLPLDESNALARWLDAVGELGDALDRLGPATVFDLAAEATGFRSAVAEGPDPQEALEELDAFRRLLAERDPVSGRDWIRRLWARAQYPLDRAAPPEPSGEDADAVRVMTIHASKGLEFEVVCVPELGAEEPRESGVVGFERDLGLAVRTVDPRGNRVRSPVGADILARAEARRRAESTRLLYVAMTRAREQLVLVGEGRKETWAAQLDVVCEGVEGIEEVLVDLEAPRPSVSKARVAAPRQLSLLDTEVAPRSIPAPLATAARATPSLVAGVTSLAELERCPRRYVQRVVAGLDEFEHVRVSGVEERASDLDPLEIGTLAHRLLERIDLDRAARDSAGALASLAEAQGVDGASLDEVADDVLGFLSSDEGRGLVRAHAADPRRVLRELPFALLVESRGASLLVRGQIDLLWIDDEGGVRVLDYKHARAPKTPAAYAFQLRTYALAARRLWGADAKLHAGLAWLRERANPVRIRAVDHDELARHEVRLASLLERTVELGRAAEPWPRLEGPQACGECGFRSRCWPQ